MKAIRTKRMLTIHYRTNLIKEVADIVVSF